jgi:hypothetical protein
MGRENAICETNVRYVAPHGVVQRIQDDGRAEEREAPTRRPAWRPAARRRR